MGTANLYPESPTNVPESLTQEKPSYRRQTMLAFGGLLLFILIYLCLMGGFAYITYKNIASFGSGGGFDLIKIINTFCSGLLALFMFK